MPAAARCLPYESRSIRRSWRVYGLDHGQSCSPYCRLQNSNLAKGQITDGRHRRRTLLRNDQISRADDYKPIIVGYNNGAAIHLSDVADVVDSVQDIRAGGYLNGKRAVVLIIFRQPGANIIDTVDRIRAALPSIKASIPQGIDTTIVSGPHHDDSSVGA